MVSIFEKTKSIKFDTKLEVRSIQKMILHSDMIDAESLSVYLVICLLSVLFDNGMIYFHTSFYSILLFINLVGLYLISQKFNFIVNIEIQYGQRN